MDNNFSKPLLKKLSAGLLQLHKALLVYEQKDYEGKFGPVGSPGRLLDLLMTSPQFDWLRALSELIVGIDEMVDSKQEADARQVAALLAYAKALLSPSRVPGSGDDRAGNFSQKYFSAMQKDPHVALAHGLVMQLLKN